MQTTMERNRYSESTHRSIVCLVCIGVCNRLWTVAQLYCGCIRTVNVRSREGMENGKRGFASRWCTTQAVSSFSLMHRERGGGNLPSLKLSSCPHLTRGRTVMNCSTKEYIVPSHRERKREREIWWKMAQDARILLHRALMLLKSIFFCLHLCSKRYICIVQRLRLYLYWRNKPFHHHHRRTACMRRLTFISVVTFVRSASATATMALVFVSLWFACEIWLDDARFACTMYCKRQRSQHLRR